MNLNRQKRQQEFTLANVTCKLLLFLPDEAWLHVCGYVNTQKEEQKAKFSRQSAGDITTFT
jgi:hypothetical protein